MAAFFYGIPNWLDYFNKINKPTRKSSILFLQYSQMAPLKIFEALEEI